MAIAVSGRSISQELLRDLYLRLCAVFTLFIICLPADGLPGVELCYFKGLTDIPCPGCGMTRAGACLIRGEVGQSIHYHPLGIAIIPALAFLGILAVAPPRWRQAVRGLAAGHDRVLDLICWTLLAGFLLFGLLRCLAVAIGLETFPATWL